MAWRERIAVLSVRSFDSRIENATGKQEDYLYNQVNQSWAYAEFATELYGRIIGLIADEHKSIEDALNIVKDDTSYLDETFKLACQSAEGL